MAIAGVLKNSTGILAVVPMVLMEAASNQQVNCMKAQAFQREKLKKNVIYKQIKFNKKNKIPISNEAADFVADRRRPIWNAN